MFKSLIILSIAFMASTSFSTQLQFGKKNQISAGLAEPGRLDTYAILEEPLIVPKTEKNTCKDDSVFWEWDKALDFRSLREAGENGHIFAYMSAKPWDCKEGKEGDQERVTFYPQAGLWAYDEVGNQVLADYVKRANKNQFGIVPRQYQAPLHVISHFGIIIRTSKGTRAMASFFAESQKGFEARETFREIKKLDSLILTTGRRTAIERYFNGRVKDPEEISKVLDLAGEAVSVWFIADNVPEYKGFNDLSVFNGWHFNEDEAGPPNLASYTCKDDLGCQKNPQK